MNSQRTAQIVIEPDDDLKVTLKAFIDVANQISPVGWNNGKPLKALDLHKATYHSVKGKLSSQLTCTAIRLVAGAYVAAKHNGHKLRRPIRFKRPFALFLVGKRGRDADFRKDGTLSIWTIAGRKHLNYTVPDYFKPMLTNAKEIDSITVKVKNGKLIGYVAITVEIPDAPGILPVGVDLNETNALVVVDPDGKELFISGLERRIKNKQTRKTIKRLQKKLAARKAEGKSTRSVARTLKRLQGKQARRTKNFCHVASKKLVEWAPQNCVLVFEDLNFKQGKKGPRFWNRRFHTWPRGMLLAFARYKVEGKGKLALVDPRNTSQICSRCGLRGNRSRHKFTCHWCGLKLHADLNAAFNIRNRYAVLRDGGPPSAGPEASSGGKLAASAVSS